MIDEYVAGLFDGEGSVSLSRNSKNSQNRYPMVSVTNTSRELLDILFNNYAGAIVNHKNCKSHYKKSWKWQLQSNKAIDFLVKIRPYMQEKEKIRRADLIIEKYKTVTTKGGKYTEEMIKAKENFEKEFFKNSNNKLLRLNHST